MAGDITIKASLTVGDERGGTQLSKPSRRNRRDMMVLFLPIFEGFPFYSPSRKRTLLGETLAGSTGGGLCSSLFILKSRIPAVI